MIRPDNPRFPHKCVIWRQIVETPLEDEDLEYDPLVDEDTDADSSSSSSSSLSSSSSDSSSSETQDETKQIIYRGECRAYDKNTTSDNGDVITSFRGLALPLTREDWKNLGIAPQEGDEVKVDRGGYWEYGRVVDKNPGNFGGTHLVVRYGRN